MTYEEMADLLSSRAVDLALFGTGKYKTLQQLHARIANNDAMLAWDPTHQHVAISMLNVKMKSYFKRDDPGDAEFFLVSETKRSLRDGALLQDRRPYLSETRKYGETAIGAMLRCFSEECDIIVDSSWFDVSKYLEEPDVHPSSIFPPGIWTHVSSRKATILVPRLPWLSREFEDDGDKITLTAESVSQDEMFDDIAKWIKEKKRLDRGKIAAWIR